MVDEAFSRSAMSEDWRWTMMDAILFRTKRIAAVVLWLSSTLSFAASGGASTSQDVNPRSSAVAFSQVLDGQSQTLLPNGQLLVTGGLEKGVAVARTFFSQTGLAAKPS